MNDMNYLLLLFVSSLGLVAGAIISFMAKEELLSGKKYFILLKHLLFLIILFLFLTNIKHDIAFCAIVSSIAFIVLFVLEKRFKFVINSILYYILLAAFAYLSRDSLNKALDFSIVFFFGIIAASIKSIKRKDSSLFLKLKLIFPEMLIYLASGVLISFIL
jgi:hypothetical protein